MTAPTPKALARAVEAMDVAQRTVGVGYVSLHADHARTILAALRSHAEAAEQARRDERERLLPWAAFGSRAFEAFWHDAEPGEVDAGDMQEMAVAAGLLARTADVDAGATHAEDCDWQPGMETDYCCCLTPMLPPLDSIRARAKEEGE